LNSVKIAPRKKPARAKAHKPAAKRAYHHGDLKDQLVAAAEAIILERGVEGFTLREAARRAGVSPAAPAHHFGDAKGLLAEVALRGYREFGDALAEGDARGGSDPAARLREQGLAYVRFALAQPARFRLMFSHGYYDHDAYPGLRATSARAFTILESAVRSAMKVTDGEMLPADAYGFLLANWSIVHGFAHLVLGGEFAPIIDAYGGKKSIVDLFLPATLNYLPKPIRK
jgi:AcrR family transcriptional regulator